MFKFELSEYVKDSVTGFKGIITGRCEYLGANNRYQVSNLIAEKMESEWIDEGRLIKVGGE